MLTFEGGKYFYINVHLPDVGTRRRRTKRRRVKGSCHLDKLRAKAPQRIRKAIHPVKTFFAVKHQQLPVSVQLNSKSPQKAFTHNSSTQQQKREKVLLSCDYKLL